MYKNPAIVKRLPRQRHSPSVLPMCYENDGKLLVALDEDSGPIGTMEVVGEFNGFDGFGGSAVYDAIEVTLNDGTLVPCYRTKSPENNYAICQNYDWKIVRNEITG